MGYKMKKFPGFGNEKSPAKDLVSAQKELDHVELDFREPGWTKVAQGAALGLKGVLGGKKEESTGDKSVDVTDIVKGLEGDDLTD
jgi:hypothetical protein